MLPGGNNTQLIIENDLTCEADYLERKESPIMPRCWDYNQTVRSAGIVTDTYAEKISALMGMVSKDLTVLQWLLHQHIFFSVTLDMTRAMWHWRDSYSWGRACCGRAATTWRVSYTL